MRKQFKLIPSYMYDSKELAEKQLEKLKQFDRFRGKEFPYLLKKEYEIRNVSNLKSARVGTHQFKYGIYIKGD